MIPIRDHPEGATFAVRVQPGARKTAITGTQGAGAEATLKLALAAPAIEDRANEALVEYFTKLFGVPRSAVHVLSGEHSRNKVIRIRGRSAAELDGTLRHHLMV